MSLKLLRKREHTQVTKRKGCILDQTFNITDNVWNKRGLDSTIKVNRIILTKSSKGDTFQDKLYTFKLPVKVSVEVPFFIYSVT